MCFLFGRCQNTTEAQFFISLPIFGLAPNTLSNSDIKFLLNCWVFQAYGTFKLFACFQHKSRSATPDTFRDSAKNLGYCYIWIGFKLCLRSNSWVARLLRLPPMFRIVRLGVQRENHWDCASSSHG